MEEEIGRRCGSCVVYAVYPLEVLKFLRFLRLRKEIFPRAVAEPEGELHCLGCNTDVHRALNRLYPIRHVGDDFPLRLDIFTLQREHDEDDALSRILEHILRQIRIDLHRSPSYLISYTQFPFSLYDVSPCKARKTIDTGNYHRCTEHFMRQICPP